MKNEIFYAGWDSNALKEELINKKAIDSIRYNLLLVVERVSEAYKQPDLKYVRD